MHFITKLKSFNLLFVFTLFLFFSCENHVQENDLAEAEEEIGQEVEKEICDPNISFAITIKPIIDNNCIRCHGGGGNQSPNLTTYIRVKNNATSVGQEVESGRMPLGGSLTTEEVDAIKCWIDNGTQE